MIKFLKYLLSFVILIVLFNILLFLASSFSSDLIEYNVIDSTEILEAKPYLYKMSNFFNITNNNATDSNILNAAYSIDNEDRYNSYMKVRKNYKRGLTTFQEEDMYGNNFVVYYNEETDTESLSKRYYNPATELKYFVSRKIHTSINYGRYWHGYLVIYRPLLILFNITELRIFLLITFIALLIYFMYLLRKRFSTSIMLIYGISLICSGYLSASYSLESSPIFLVTMISSIIYLIKIDKMKNFGLYIFAIGCIANYFDFLTVPLISLGVPCSLYFLKSMEEEINWKTRVKQLLIFSLLWVTGYALTWFTKWVLFDLTIESETSMIEIGIKQVLLRVDRTNELTPNASLYDTVVTILGKSSFYTILTVGILMCINKFKVSIDKFNYSTLPFLILSIYPIIWYVVLANHTLFHYFFTYRHSLLYMLGLLLFINQLFFKNNINKKHYLSRLFHNKID